MCLQAAVPTRAPDWRAPPPTVGATTPQEGPMTTSTTSTTTKKTDDDLATTAKVIATDVADRAASAAQRLPEAASATGAQIERASMAMQRESDEVLAVGTSLSLGLALGLLLG